MFVDVLHTAVLPVRVLLCLFSLCRPFVCVLPRFNVCRTMCGTPAYLAPEILMNQSYGISVDLWSLGVVTFSLLTAANPFHSKEVDPHRQLLN